MSVTSNNNSIIIEICKIFDIKKYLSWIEVIIDSNDWKMKFRKMINFNE